MVSNGLQNFVKRGKPIMLPPVDSAQEATPPQNSDSTSKTEAKKTTSPQTCASTSAPPDLTAKTEAAENEKTAPHFTELPPCPHCEIEPFPKYDDPYLRADHPFWKGKPPKKVVEGILP